MCIRSCVFFVLTVTMCAAQPPEPDVALSVNGKVMARLHPGQPLMVQLLALHPHLLEPEPGEDVRPVLLPAVDGSWAKAVQLALFNQEGEAVTAEFVLHAPPGERLELNAGEQAAAWWSLPPVQTEKLAPGRYLVRAVLDTTAVAVGDEWSGTVTAEMVPVELVAPMAEPPVDEQALGHRLAAQYAALQTKWDEALEQVDGWIALQPESALARALKGEILMRAGRPLQAAQSYSVAMELDAAAARARELNAREGQITLDGKMSEALRALVQAKRSK